MRLIIYPLLGTDSKRAITRVKKKWGHPYVYNPRAKLIQRIERELGWSKFDVIMQFRKERKFLIKNKIYYR